MSERGRISTMHPEHCGCGSCRAFAPRVVPDARLSDGLAILANHWPPKSGDDPAVALADGRVFHYSELIAEARSMRVNRLLGSERE